MYLPLDNLADQKAALYPRFLSVRVEDTRVATKHLAKLTTFAGTDNRGSLMVHDRGQAFTWGERAGKSVHMYTCMHYA